MPSGSADHRGGVLAKQILKRTAQDIIELSQIAHEVREQVGYQEYVRWVKEDLGLSERQGIRFLQVYDKFGSTAKLAVIDISPSAVYLLAEAPEPARQEAIERAEAGETISHPARCLTSGRTDSHED